MTRPSVVDERVPPHDIEIEQSVLGAMMLSGENIDTAMLGLHAEDFYRPAHQRIFRAMCDLRVSGREADVLSIKNELSDEIDAFGGPAYLLEVQGAAISSASLKHHVDIVRNRSKARRLISVGVSIQASGYEAGDDVDEAVGDAMSMVTAIALTAQNSALPVGAVMTELLEQLRLGPRDYIAPPLMPWVQIEGGELVILAAGTSVGKTATALNWADEWSKTVPVTFFEYEMSEVSLASRLASKYSGVTLAQMREGVGIDDMDKVYEAGEMLKKRDLTLETVWCDIGMLTAKIRNAALGGTKVVFIDHLGLIPFSTPKGENYAKALGSQVTNRLKRLAMSLNIVIVLLCQINREGQKRVGKYPYPVLQDLRDSGEIEQDGDKVIMLYRYKRRDEDEQAFIQSRDEAGMDLYTDDRDLIHVGVVKYRNGPTGHAHLAFTGDVMRYESIHESRPAIAKDARADQPAQTALV